MATPIPTVPSQAGNNAPPNAAPTFIKQNASLAWSDQLKTLPIYPFNPPNPVGPTITIPDTPLDIFHLFFDENLVDGIVQQSNQYALEVMGPTKFTKWTPITKEDITAFTGFHFLMGLNPKPTLYDYWSRDPVYNYPPIADKISRNRYLQ